ncbi:MAG TPA: 1-deoxy-D-xylulose-5-phosphate reductoisomerase [Hyphomicrobiales bacterium]|nr:1-deoxy-D-xylulose-5-phosphate reductoisomerase [Hyphomicrobiales bacterium]
MEASASAPRAVSVLGSTGSIGCNTVEILGAHRDRFVVEALTANANAALLAEQARALGARFAAVAEEAAGEELRQRLAGSGIECGAGRAAVIEAALRPADWLMAAIVGVVGLEPTLAALRQGVDVALANKECLVSAGAFFMAEAERAGAAVIPVDSEHSAIFQILGDKPASALERIVLTASGGPFRDWPRERMAAVTPEQALQHPNWDMGAKITIDSATMMNKGLELIEAHHLFALDAGRIDILVHPESAVHGLVEFADGSMLAQLGAPDMRTPIAVSLAWPERMAVAASRLDLAALGKLSFEPPDEERFPSLRIARAALGESPAAPAILNAANEVAVEAFLARAIGFLDIPAVVEATIEAELAETPAGEAGTLEGVLEIDARARQTAGKLVAARATS